MCSRLKPYRIIGLLVAVVLAIVLALPELRRTYVGAFLTGVCATSPSARECNPPGNGQVPSTPLFRVK
jgi:hypothetical protein